MSLLLFDLEVSISRQFLDRPPTPSFPGIAVGLLCCAYPVGSKPAGFCVSVAGKEYDAAQERGEVRTRADNQHVPAGNKPTVADIGLTRKQIHNARSVRDVEKIGCAA
jgi:hypothetical protein